jgi:hypothetical protein
VTPTSILEPVGAKYVQRADDQASAARSSNRFGVFAVDLEGEGANALPATEAHADRSCA